MHTQLPLPSVPSAAELGAPVHKLLLVMDRLATQTDSRAGELQAKEAYGEPCLLHRTADPVACVWRTLSTAPYSSQMAPGSREGEGAGAGGDG